LSRKLSNFLGIDFGQKKIGLAVSPGGKLAFGFKVLSKGPGFWLDLEKILHEQEIDLIVLGMPLKTSGEKCESSLAVTSFKKELEKRMKNIKVETIDERFSSKEAQRNLTKNKQQDDQEAARIILQSFLDLNLK